VESLGKATRPAFENQAPQDDALRLEQFMRQFNTVGECDEAAATLVYLTSKRDVPDAATQFAEECVKNAAACEVARLRPRNVLVLLRFALPRSRLGIVEALAEVDSLEPIPYSLRMLEDDLCQAPAMDAVRRFGREAELPLITSLQTRLPSREEERPSSTRRRAISRGLVAEIGPSPKRWPLLRPLLKRKQIQVLLIDLYPDAKPLVEKEWAARSRLAEIERVLGSTVRVLESVRHNVAEAPRQGA
jgi:hypothetical protein